MTRLFFGNFDFEHRLAFESGWQPTSALQRLNAELASAWIAIADEDDLILSPEPIGDEFFHQLVADGFPRVSPVRDVSKLPADVELCPWGWSPEVRKWDVDSIHIDDAPALTSVRKANSRLLSARLEREWNVALPGACELTDVDDLLQLIESAASEIGSSVEDQRWVIKSEFSMSARERIIGHGAILDDPTANWIRKRLDRDGVVFFEPWVGRLAEVGLQFEIPQTGTPRFVGVTDLITDDLGAYRGSRFAFEIGSTDKRESCWKNAIDTGWRVAEHIQQTGYFGPLGIDAVQYRLPNNEIGIRPIQDINARHTMGLLSLGFRRLLGENEVASWLHLRWNADVSTSPFEWLACRKANLPQTVRVIPTTPFEVGGTYTHHGSVLVIAGNSSALAAAESVLLDP